MSKTKLIPFSKEPSSGQMEARLGVSSIGLKALNRIAAEHFAGSVTITATGVQGFSVIILRGKQRKSRVRQ